MAKCLRCGEFVTENYVRVFAPEGEDGPRVCPHCEDAVREGTGIRLARR